MRQQFFLGARWHWSSTLRAGCTQQIITSFPLQPHCQWTQVTQWMFDHKVIISCLCWWPGRGTAAVVATVCLFRHPSLHYTHNVALASCMISCECRGVHASKYTQDDVRQPSHFDYFSGLWFYKDKFFWITFVHLYPIEQTFGRCCRFACQLKNCVATLVAMETSWTVKTQELNWTTNTSQDNLLSFWHFKYPPTVPKAFRTIHWRLWTRMTITSQNGFFFLVSCTSQIMDPNKVHDNPHPHQNPSQDNLKLLAPQKTETWLCDLQSIKSSPAPFKKKVQSSDQFLPGG